MRKHIVKCEINLIILTFDKFITNFDIVIDEYFDLSYLSRNEFFEDYENFQIFVININFNRFFNFF